MQRPDMKNPVHFLAFGFGSGLAPKAPGTFGTLAALPVWWLAAQLPLWGYVVVLLAVIAVGPYLCGRTAKDLASCCSGCSISPSPGRSAGWTGRSTEAPASWWMT